MTAGEVLERIKKNLGVPWNDRTYRDTFKIGGPETEVTGIASTFMCSLDLLQRAERNTKCPIFREKLQIGAQ